MKKLIKKMGDSSIIFTILASFLVTLIIEVLSEGGFKGAINHITGNPLIFIYSIMILFATYQLAFLLKRRIFYISLVSIVWIGLATTNAIILSNRVTPLTYIDLKMFSNVLTILNKYLNGFQLGLIIIALILVVICLVFMFIYSPKRTKKISYKRNLACIVAYTAFFLMTTVVLIKQGFLSIYFGNIANAYLEYGFPYSFCSTAINTGVSRPKDYSENRINEIKEKVKDEESKNEKVNIIMLQLESFFDPSHVKGIKLSENPIPTFTELRDKYSSGYLTVPGYGAGTANTEFEIMTGMSLDYFGTGEYPYKTILKKKTCENINYTLKDLGYSTHAIHNNRSTFYSRNVVFPNLGFDTFTSLEFMNAYDLNPIEWAKDKYLTEEIMKCLKYNDNPDYIYTISVQGHGEYPKEVVDENQTITIDGIEDEGERNAFEYYVNQIHEMDKFVKDLTETLEKYDEKVVLVMYGDHLPTLHIGGKQISDDMLTNGDMYQTQYIMWNNFGLEKQDKDLFAYQLSAEIANRLDIHNGTLIKYHQQLQNEPDYQQGLRLLQYDMLYGKQYIYGRTNPFKPTNMRYDVEDVKIDRVYTANGNIYVAGENFTEYSAVYVNDKKLKTTFINKELLEVENEKLDNEDDIYIMQIGANGKSKLSKSGNYVYEKEPEKE